MPDTGKRPSLIEKNQINKMAIINTGMLYPIIVPIWTAVSRLLPFFTAQKIPSGMVIPSARIVAKILRNNVFRRGALITCATGFAYVTELPKLPCSRPLNEPS